MGEGGAVGRPASIDNAPWSPFLVRMVSMNLMSYQPSDTSSERWRS